MTTLNVATLTAALASVPAATVEAARATVARDRDVASVRRGMPVARTLSAFSHGPTTGDDGHDEMSRALTLPYVLAVASRMSIGRTGRPVTIADVMPDGFSSVSDVHADAWTHALESWRHVQAHAAQRVRSPYMSRRWVADATCDRKRCTIVGDVTGGVVAQSMARHSGECYVYTRLTRCGTCEECVASVDAATDRALPRESTGRAYGKASAPVVANVPGRFAVGRCTAPVPVAEIATPARAARRAVFAAAQSALTVQGSKTFGRRGFNTRSIDDTTRSAAATESLHADIHAQWSADAQQTPEDVRTFLTAIVATVGEENVIARNGRVSDAAWSAIALAMGSTTGEAARATMRKRLTALRAGDVTLASILASV